MTLSPGTRLGPYEVLAPLGAGGMGEVYRARDSRLERDVAIKVLPAELASDAERLKRFEKEARSASALNHPNIVTIYDIGSEGGVSYIAMERVEGATLRDLLGSGPLSIKKLLQIAPQITEGLAKAHEAGIVHRDLKPENVMVTKEGLVKILDFGLAKLTSTMSGSGEGSQLPTMTGTTPGVIVGTVGYMSPEQASGGALDFRSDQFAIGSILYEMATGRRAFQKKTAIETLSAILREEPEPITSINPQVPGPVRWTIERCLAKEPEDRYASTSDLAKDLANLGAHLSEVSVSGVVVASAPRRRRLAGLGLVLVVAAIALFAGTLAARKLSKPVVPSYQRLTFRYGGQGWARFTPDGQTIIYNADWDKEPGRLYSTRVDSPESRALDLPAGTQILSISKSGEMAIALNPRGGTPFDALGTLARVPLAGGAPREVLEDVNGADFSPDGKDLAIIREVAGKRRLEFPIGKVLYEADAIFQPRVSPKGDSIAFLEDLPEERGICLIDLAGHKRVLVQGVNAFMFAWSPTGDEIWYAARDVRAVSLSGRERVLLQYPEPTWAHLNDIAADGRVLIVIADWRTGMIALAPGETRERDISWQGYSGVSDLTPDGKTVLFSDNGGSYIRRTDGLSSPVRIGGECFALSPDAKRVLCNPEGAGSGILVSPTGSGESKVVEAQGITFRGGGGSWFPDGARILLSGRQPGRPWRNYVISIEGGAPRAVTPEGVDNEAMSPDGRLLAVKNPERQIVLYPVEGGDPRRVPGGPELGDIVGWSSDGSAVLVSELVGATARVSRRDVATGERRPWKELTPPIFGVFQLHPVFSLDGGSYVYTYNRWISNLYIIKGLK